MKELNLQNLLNMADAPAHDGICDLWNQKTVHYLVVFTSADQDFEIIGAGPTLPYATLEDAAKHVIPGKNPEFFVKCPAASAGRLQPKLAPSLLSHAAGAARSVITPSMKARTAVPFPRLQQKPVAAPAPAPVASTPPPLPSSTVVETPTPPAPAVSQAPTVSTASVQATPASQPVPSASSTSNKIDLEKNYADRLAALTQREQELDKLSASLKIREATLREREAAVVAWEDLVIKPPSRSS